MVILIENIKQSCLKFSLRNEEKLILRQICAHLKALDECFI